MSAVRSARPSRGQRALATLAAVVLFAASLAAGYMALLFAILSCGETCGSDGATWKEDVDAWQWDFQFYWAGTVVLLALAVIPLAAAGRFRAAAYLAAVTLGLGLGWLAFLLA